MERSGNFADKLTLVLKALSISRARLAAAAGVDKSLVGRWCAGTYAPAAHNLERITQTIAERVPGFTMHDWDRSIDDLAGSLGVQWVSTRPDSGDRLTIPLPPAIAAATRARAADFEGIWRVTYSAGINEQPEMFIHTYGLVRLEPDGRLLYRAGVFEVRLEGSAILANNQLFLLAINPARGTLSLAILNCVADGKAQLFDGITLSCRDGLGGTPVVAACISERVADLTGDIAFDDQRFAALCAQHPVAPPGAVSPEIRDHLLRDSGRTAAAAGGDLLMVMPHLRSLACSSEAAVAPPALRIVS
jgi:transcriptional regulator with XRE-family HTH domain